jgi:hypothetical protein
VPDKRPTCKLCHHRESTVFCCYHRQYLCTPCADRHIELNWAVEREGHCYWTAAPPLRLLASEQLSFQFSESSVVSCPLSVVSRKG